MLWIIPIVFVVAICFDILCKLLGIELRPEQRPSSMTEDEQHQMLHGAMDIMLFPDDYPEIWGKKD